MSVLDLFPPVARASEEDRDWLARMYSSQARSQAPRKQYKLTQPDLELVNIVVGVLKLGDPTPFEFEGACHNGLRGKFCLEGATWRRSDIRAKAIVDRALTIVGAVRPEWHDGQPEAVQETFAPIQRRVCLWCEGPMKLGTNKNGVAKKYCSRTCQGNARRARDYQRTTLEEFLSKVKAQAVERQKEREKPCKHCGKLFVPDARRTDEKEYCSIQCVHAMQKLEPKECLNCKKLFQPKKGVTQFCSMSCAQNKNKRPSKICMGCGSTFHPRASISVYCSRACYVNRPRKAASC